MLSPSAGNERQINIVYCSFHLVVMVNRFLKVYQGDLKRSFRVPLQDWQESGNKRIETPVRLFTEQKETKTFFFFARCIKQSM